MKYVAVDSGKYATKVSAYDPETKKLSKFKFRTKYGEGNLLDDTLEKGTFVAGIEGKAYRIGNGGMIEAELNTSKKSEIHKLCTLAAIARCVTEEHEEICVCIGIPVNEYQVFDIREEYKKYILPDGEISITLKMKGDDPVETKTFMITSKYVFPESAGALYMNVEKSANKVAAIIDIGNLNINCTCWDDFRLDEKYTITDELGGNIMISGLAQDLSTEFSRCDENLVARVLKKPLSERHLQPIRPNKELEEKSKELISDYLLRHTRAIKKKCDTKKWPLEFMELIFIGGTSQLLQNEIKEVFGEEVVIPENPEYVNVVGFLRRLCSKYGIDINNTKETDENEEIEEKKKK